MEIAFLNKEKDKTYQVKCELLEIIKERTEFYKSAMITGNCHREYIIKGVKGIRDGLERDLKCYLFKKKLFILFKNLTI